MTMPEIRGKTLVMVIQAVESEIRRLRGLPDEQTVPEDEERLVAFENVAEELEDLYEEARATETSLPAYARLVKRAS
jgi:hypothetical protein